MKQRAMVRGFILSLLVAQACGGPENSAGDAPDTGAANAQTATVEAAPVSRAQFDSLTWLLGDWRGSGGAYPAFFESYRRLNDSTIEMRAWADSTFAVATDSSEIAWRAGVVQSLSGGTVQNVLVRIGGDSLHFAKMTGQGGDFVWAKETADRWTAILEPAAVGGEPTVYRMVRIRP